jgi:hypothetical protein
MNFLADHVRRTELAKGLGDISERSIARYENEPDGLPYTIVGGCKWYHVESVRAWLKRREHRPNPTRATRRRTSQAQAVA